MTPTDARRLPSDDRIQLRLRPDLLEAIDHVAEECETDRANAVVYLAQLGLEALKHGGAPGY